MSQVILQAMPAASVASGATIAFTLPTGLNLGHFKLNSNHKLVARGLQAVFSCPQDFTVAYSGATVTVTYNGTTAIPGGTQVLLQLEVGGDVDGEQSKRIGNVKDYLGFPRAFNAAPVRVIFGAVATASATAVLGATAVASTAKVTLASPVVLDVPRGVRIVSSSAGDTTQVITIYGTDEYGVAMSENITANGTSVVNGKKAFATVTAYKASVALAGNLSIGTQAGVLGLPFFLAGGTSAGIGYILREIQDGALATAGTFVGGDTAKATATTGDVRGTWTPNAAPDAAKVYEVVMMASDTQFLGVPQFTA